MHLTYPPIQWCRSRLFQSLLRVALVGMTLFWMQAMAAATKSAPRALAPTDIPPKITVATAIRAPTFDDSDFDAPTFTPPSAKATTEAATETQSEVADAVMGVFQDKVIFGQSAAFSGLSSEFGNDVRLGIEAAFHEVNEEGGIHGRRLDLIALDDASEPEIAIANTRRLVDKEQVFALIGAVGTANSRFTIPIAVSRGVPYIAPFTGARFLRDPTMTNVINLRASHEQETEAMVSRLIRDLGIDRIAVMYQDDSFGVDGYLGVVKALKRRNMAPVAIGLYPRNTTSVKTALLSLRRGDPEAVIMIAASKAVATLITWAHHTGFDPIFVNISFVGSNKLARALGATGVGVFVTQVVPFPAARNTVISKAYARALTAYNKKSQLGFVSFEGYLAGRLAIEALFRAGPEPDRDKFLGSLRNANSIDLDDFKLNFGDNDNQGSDKVYFTVIGPGKRFYPIKRLNQRVY